jgi:acetolactate synthase-1/2/3 large subunit
MAAQLGIDNFWNEYPADEWSDAIVMAMKLGGVDRLFFVSGSESAFLQEATAKAAVRGTPAPKLITMIHESVALQAALGAAMVTGRPTATSAHVDVGTLHYGGAIHTAWRGGYPVLITGSTGPRGFPDSMRGARNSPIQWLQEPRDQGEIMRQFTKADHRLEHIDNPGLIVSRLLQIALSEPKGPVYLTMPRETAMLPLPGKTRFPTVEQLGVARPVSPDLDDARTIANWLVKAENPLICTDRVTRDPQALEEIQRLAELLALPVAESDNSDRMNFPTTHALYGTGPQAKEADVVVVFESAVPWMPGAGSPPADARIAWIAIDPVHSRLKTLEYRADLWIPATASRTARAIREAAESMLDKSDLSRVADRRKRLEDRKRQMSAKAEELAMAEAKAGRCSGRWAAYQLGKILEPDAIVLNDGISNGPFVHTYAKRTQPGTYFRSGSSTGGWGSGAAFGIKLSCPSQDVVLASGDGYYSFGTPMAALWAARHHKAPFLALVFVNGTYSTGTTGLRSTYPDGYAVKYGNYDGGSFDPPPNFAKYAEAVDGYGEYVTDAERVGPALKRGLEATRNGSPAVIAVRVPGPLQDKQGVGTPVQPA